MLTLALEDDPNIGSEAPMWDDRMAARVRSLVEQNYRFVWRSLRRLGVASADVDDAAQQVFWVAARRIGGLLPNKDRSFLFGVCVRVASEHRRTMRRRRECTNEPDPEWTDDHPSPEQLVTDRRALAILDELLGTMTMDLRTVFVLYEVEEMEMREIAELLGVPAGTVASRLRRAREQFQARAELVRTGLSGGSGR